MNRRPLIPSLEKVKNAIANFNLDSLKDFDPAQVDNYVQKLDAYFVNELGLLFRTLRTSSTNKLPSTVYRVRKYDPQINRHLISEFSFPPAALCKQIQRANLPYHPVFYCAPSAFTAFLETLEYTYKQGEQNVYYLSEWAFRKDQPAYITPFLFGKYEKVEFYNRFREKPLADLAAQIPDLTADEKQAIEAIFGFVAELFEYEDTHAISGYLGHIHLYAPSNMRTDVFVYPSIRTGKASMNFAIHPNAVLHKLQLRRIFVIQVNGYSVDHRSGVARFDYTVRDQLGINNEHGYLIWRNLPQEDLDDFKQWFPAGENEAGHKDSSVSK